MTSTTASEDLHYKIADVKRQINAIVASIDAGLLAVAHTQLELSQSERDLIISQRAVKFMKNEADMVAMKDFRKQVALVERLKLEIIDLKVKVAKEKVVTDKQGETVLLLKKMLAALEKELRDEEEPLTNLIKLPVRAI